MKRFYVLLAMLAALVTTLPGAATAAAPSATLFVAADASWVTTGVTVTAGDSISIVAHGQAITGPLVDFPGARSGPDGQLGVPCGFSGNPDPCNLDGVDYGTLVAWIDAPGGAAFAVGSSYAATAASSGMLYLAVNDNLGTHFDNSAGYAVQVTATP